MSNPDRLGQTFGGVSELYTKYGSRKSAMAVAEPDVRSILGALNEFMECVRYLNTRRSTSTILKLDSESAVQDAIYLMLKPWVHDLTPENPTDKVAGRYVIKDFLSKAARTVVEAKYIRDAKHGKNIAKELHDDIEMYRHHPHCSHLVFFIYDPAALIPDRAALLRQITVQRLYDGIPLTCHLILMP